MLCRVQFRRGGGFTVKPEYEHVNGQTFDLVHHGEVRHDEGCASCYTEGESQWVFKGRAPLDAPGWFAEGDLKFVDQVYAHETLYDYVMVIDRNTVKESQQRIAT